MGLHLDMKLTLVFVIKYRTWIKILMKVVKILGSHEVYCYMPPVAAKWIFAVCGIVTLYGGEGSL
jgi:hypothetical protein